MMRTGRTMVPYAGAMALLTLLYLSWPQASSALGGLVGLGGAGAIVLGVRRHRPRRAWAWLVLAGSLLLNAIARVVYDALPGEAGTLRPGVWLVWLLHLAMLVLLVVATLSLARPGVHGASAAIDTAIILLGAGLLLGVLIAVPYAGTKGIGPLWASARAGYVARDAVVLAIAAYLAMVLRRNASAVLLVSGLLALFGYDVLFRLGRVRGEWLSGTAIDLGWLWFFIAIGAAALTPSMAELARVSPASGPGASRQATQVRLGLVLIAALMPSVVLLVGIFKTPPWHQGLLVLTATVILILAFTRVMEVTAQLRGQLLGERVVRDTTAELAGARDLSTIVTVLDRAVGHLLGQGQAYRVALTAARPDTVRAATRPTIAPPGQAQPDDAASAFPLSAAPSGPAGDPEGQPPGADAGQLLLVYADPAALARAKPRVAALATQAGLAVQRIRLNDELIRRTREAYFRTLVQRSADIILIVDDHDRIRYATPSASTLTGPRPLEGTPLLDLVEPSDRAAAAGLLRASRSGGDEFVPGADAVIGAGSAAADRTMWTIRTAGGSAAQVEVSCRDLRSDPSIDGLVLTLRNVTEQRMLQHELTRRAFHDPLTGLSNRLPFIEQLDAIVRAQADTGMCAGILYVDLDDLQLVNDGFGHGAGDAVLTTVADRLRDFAAAPHGQTASIVARLGGDEFAVLFSGVADQSEFDRAADVLTDRLSRPMRFDGSEVICPASVGVATTAEAPTSQELLRNADLALYAAKGAGKRQWRRYEAWMRTTLVARLALRTALGQAIDNGEFFLEYQPIVALHGGRTVGFEALVRWQHPARGRLGPDQFIDVAEESGLIVPLGEWVLANALRAARGWPGDIHPYVGVNISARQFRDRGFVTTFERLLGESGLPPDRVLLEITESLLLREEDRVWLDLQQLRHRGIRVAVDDFGTGYSALSYLRHVPLDVIKLDRSFITSMADSPRQRALVRGIVGLARTLDLEVIAEGIEIESERVAAAEAGCEYGQGFLFSPPLSDVDARRWIEAGGDLATAA